MCVGIPGQIVAVHNEEQQLVAVDIMGIQRPVNVACVIEDGKSLQDMLGAWVLVHVGFAMSCIDEQEAQETLTLLKELGETAVEGAGPLP